MSNSLSGGFKQYWSKRVQRKYYKTAVFREIANFEAQQVMENGQQFNRPYQSNLAVKTVGTDGAFSRQDITDTNEYLTVDQWKEISFYLNRQDAIQAFYNVSGSYADQAGKRLGEHLDGVILGEISNADSDVDDGDIGGTDGNGITLAISNVYKIFSIAARKLDTLNIDQSERVAVLSPHALQTLRDYLGNKETTLGDAVQENGKIGSFLGFQIYISNSLYWTGRLEVGTQATDGDTVVINGVTFTFETGTLDAAGKVKSETSAAVCIDNLVAAINNSESLAASTLGTAYYEVTAANRALLQDITATDGTTYMTLAAKGHSYIAVSETLSAAADIWTAAKQLQWLYFGRKGASDMIIQQNISLLEQDRSGYIGKDFVTHVLYGYKTFDEGDAMMCAVKVRSDAY